MRLILKCSVLYLLCTAGACSGTQPTGDLLTSLTHRVLAGRSSVEFQRDVQPILEHRCVVCHGCFDAPCQLKLESLEGLRRGASKDIVYDGSRLLAATPTRLFEDAVSVEQWRDMGFHPVLNETPLPATTAARRRADLSGHQNLHNSVLARTLVLKQEHPQPETPRLPASVNLDLNRAQVCPTLAEFETYRVNNPLWGMPYGLPQLSRHEFQTIMHWVRDGSPVPTNPYRLREGDEAMVQAWEQFLNGDSAREQLVARYIYEHLFYANILLEEETDRTPRYFHLVRSRTAAPFAVERIATRRPFDDPAVARVYYRLVPMQESIVAKRHLPMLLDADKLQRYRELFFETEYEVESLPGYEDGQAANPFHTFVDIPVAVRYRFMLEEAQFYIGGFIKGPVCRGQVALDVINDHFWVAFVDPENGDAAAEDRFLQENASSLILPAGDGSNAFPGVSWWKYARANNRYTQARAAYLAQRDSAEVPVGMDAIWDGDGENTNAALTIFRHFDSASVVRGWVGQVPKTAWVIDYPLLERIHYLLVAGFDVFGNVGHQLHTRLYMDFLRMEGEMNFLSMLPEAYRKAEWEFWYRGARDVLMEYLETNDAFWHRETGVVYQTSDYKKEFFTRLRDHLGDAVSDEFTLASMDLDSDKQQALQLLSSMPVSAVNLLPQIALLALVTPGERPQLVSLLHNNGHSNIAQLFSEEERRLPAEDTLTVAPGVIGAYPNVFLQVGMDQLEAFVAAVRSMRNEQDYRVVLDQYGIRRTDPRFWHFADSVHAEYRRLQPVRAGILDFNRLENR